MDKTFYLLLILICCSCAHNSEVEKYQNKRDNVINVRDKIKKIQIKNVLIGRYPDLYLIDDYLIVRDHKSWDKFIHLFDKKSFLYITSFADRGEGPAEITNIGHIGIDESNRTLFVSDHGKQCIFSYNLDSVITNSQYIPQIKMRMGDNQFPSDYQYVNDTLSIGLIIKPIGNSDFKPTVARWNMNTGDIQPMKYEHPEIEKKRITFAVSMENGIYVECYNYHDLMTICDLNGNLKYNVYGRNWDSRKSMKSHYYSSVSFCGNKIITTYSGGNNTPEEYDPTKFLVFDLNGNYIQTLETGYKISHFCYDKESNRILMSLDDAELQFAYLNLDEIVEVK